MAADFSLATESSAAHLHSAGATIALSKVMGSVTLLQFAMRDPRVAAQRVEQAMTHLATLQRPLLAQGGVGS